MAAKENGLSNSGTEERNTSVLAASRPESRKGARRLWTMVAGDAVAFLVFAIIGRRSHGEGAGLQAVLQIAWTALPFLVAWFLIAPLLGAFRRDVLNDPKKMEAQTLKAWIAAWPLGLLLHFVSKQELPTISTVVSFGLVTLITNALFLSIWRLPLAFFTRKNDR